jgi:hypothetical protein
MASEQGTALQRHLEYCREIVVLNEEAIMQMECGGLRVSDDNVDMTAIWIGKLKEQNDILRKNLADFEPATSAEGSNNIG